MADDAETGLAAGTPPGLLDRIVTALAVAGGALSLGVAVLVTVSVARRWLGFQPIPGDFEFVQMATAVSIFSFLYPMKFVRPEKRDDVRTGLIMVPIFVIPCLTGWYLTKRYLEKDEVENVQHPSQEP